MTLVVLGIDALDPELVDATEHPHLTLNASRTIDTIDSSAGDPSTHELWPTIITGLRPEEHGLVLDEGVAWDNPLLQLGSQVASYILPDGIQARIGAWLLNNTTEDAFRTSATYYAQQGLDTIFDGRESKSIGIPNYVVDKTEEDREHQLRRQMGELFERNPDTETGHSTNDPITFYEQCLEMAMIRIVRVRRALRNRSFELVFGYTSGLDLIGHVAYERQELQSDAYDELNDFVGELEEDLREEDELVVISDHGLQNGVHTHQAMIATTDQSIIEGVESVLDVASAIETELDSTNHKPEQRSQTVESDEATRQTVEKQLEDLGYM